MAYAGIWPSYLINLISLRLVLELCITAGGGALHHGGRRSFASRREEELCITAGGGALHHGGSQT